MLVSRVPGTAAAWTRAIEEFGSKPPSEAFAPAIEYAEHGFSINTSLARSIESSAEVLMKYPSSAKIFAPNGKPLKAGEMLVDLANTFRSSPPADSTSSTRGSSPRPGDRRHDGRLRPARQLDCK